MSADARREYEKSESEAKPSLRLAHRYRFCALSTSSLLCLRKWRPKTFTVRHLAQRLALLLAFPHGFRRVAKG
jgi:hypothetical protein